MRPSDEIPPLELELLPEDLLLDEPVIRGPELELRELLEVRPMPEMPLEREALPELERELLLDRLELLEERPMPELRLELERELPPYDRELEPEERLLLPEERLEPLLRETPLLPERLIPEDRPAEEPLLREEPPVAREELPELPRVTRCASMFCIGAANTTTASTAKNVNSNFLGVNIDDLRPSSGRANEKSPTGNSLPKRGPFRPQS